MAWIWLPCTKKATVVSDLTDRFGETSTLFVADVSLFYLSVSALGPGGRDNSLFP